MTKVTGATYSVSFGNSECSFTTDGTTPTLTKGTLTLSSSNVEVNGKFTTQQPTLTINALTSAGGTNLLDSDEIEWGIYVDAQGKTPATDDSNTDGWYKGQNRNLTGWGNAVVIDSTTGTATINVDPKAAEGTYYLIAKAKADAQTVASGSMAVAQFAVTHKAAELESIKVENGDKDLHNDDKVELNGTDVALTVTGIDQFGYPYNDNDITLGVMTATSKDDLNGSNPTAHQDWINEKTVTVPGKNAAEWMKITAVDTVSGHAHSNEAGKSAAATVLQITRATSVAQSGVFYVDTKKLEGTDTVSVGEVTYAYTLVDQFGDEMTTTDNVTWTVTKKVAGATFDTTTGKLTVEPTCAGGEMTVKAAVGSVESTLTINIVALTFDTAITVTTKGSPTFGDKWDDIVTGVKVGENEGADITAQGIAYTAKLNDDAVVGKIFLKGDSSAPNAGTQTAAFTFSADDESSPYQNVAVPANKVSGAEVEIAKASFTPTVTIDGWTYGDTANEPSVGTTNTSNGDVTYAYKVKDAADDTYSDAVPANAGDYTVRATVAATGNYNEATATADFTVAPKALTLTWPTSTSFTYGDSYSATATPTNAVTGDEIELAYTYAGRDGTAYETIATAPTDVGKYTVTAALAEAASGNANANYTLEGVTNTTCDFEITKAANTIAWTAASYTYVYGSDSVLPQATADSGAAAVKYYTNEECTSELVSTTALDAGTYYAKATAEGTNNYQSATAITTTFTVTKAVYAGTGDTVESIYVPTLASKDRSYTVTADAFTCLADVNGFKDWFVKNPTIGTNTSGLLGTTVSVDSNDKKTIHYTTNASNVDDTATITFKIESKNYQDVSATLTLTAKSIVPKMDGSTNLTFAGVSAVAGKAYGAKDSELVTITGTAAVALDAMGNEVSGTIAAKTPNNVQSVNENGNTVIVEFTAGTGEYEGATIEYEVPVTIAPKAVTLEWSDEELTFNGQPQSKISTIGGYVGEETGLVVETYSYAGSAGTEYQQSATKPTNAGTYTATATALKADAGATANAANYRLPDDASTTFTISPKTLTAADIEVSAEETEFTYDGTAHTLEGITVTNPVSGGTTLTLTPNDYEVVDYSENVNVKWDSNSNNVLPTGEVSLTLKGNFTTADGNSIKVSGIMTINPKKVTEQDVTFSVANEEYTRGALNDNLTVTVKDKEQALTAGTDYTITYSPEEVQNVGTYTATITGKGNYTSTRSTTFKVTGKVVSDATITLYAPGDTEMTGSEFTTASYTGSEIKPVVKAVVGGERLVKDTDYTVAYSGNVNASTETAKAKVIVTFRGNYVNGKDSNGTKVFFKEFTIEKAPISGFTVSYNNGAEGELTYAFDGKAHAPAVKVSKTESGITTTLRNGTDYTVTLKKDQNDLTAAPINAGTYTVTVAAKDGGNYTGSFEPKTFTITPAEITPTINGLPTGMAYDGAAKTVTPTVTATLNSANITLVEGTDYSIAYTYAAFGADGDETATDAQYSSASTIQNAGSYKATVTLAANGNYALAKGATDTATFSVARAPRTIKLVDSLTISAGNNGGAIRVVEDNAADKANSGAYTFAAPVSSEVQIETSGNVATAKKSAASNGAVTITVNAKRTQNYGAATATIPVTFVADTVQILTPPSAPVLTVEYGETGAANRYTTNAAGNTITYASSNTGVATVGSDGAITTVGVGTTTITVSAPEKNDFAATTTSYTFTVTPKILTPTWTLAEGDNPAATFTATNSEYKTADYNGAKKTVSATISGAVSEDDVNVSGSKEATNAGTYTLTVSLTGADAAKYQLSTDTLNFVVPKAMRTNDVTLTAGDATLGDSFTLTPADNAAGNAKIGTTGTTLTISYTGKDNAADANLIATSSDPSALTVNANGELVVKKNFTNVTLTFKLPESANYLAAVDKTYTVSKGVINPVTEPTTALDSEAKSTVSVAFENGKIVVSGLVGADAMPAESNPATNPIVIRSGDNTITLALTKESDIYGVNSVTLSSGTIDGYTAEQIKALIDVSGLSAAPTTVKAEVGENLVVEVTEATAVSIIPSGVSVTTAMVTAINDVTAGVKADEDKLVSALTSVISDVDNKDSKSNTVNDTLKGKIEEIQTASASGEVVSQMQSLATTARNEIDDKDVVYEQNDPDGSWITEDNFAIVMEPSIKVEPKEFKFDNGGSVTSFKLDIKPQFVIFARETSGGAVDKNGRVTQLTNPQPVSSRDLKNEIPVTVALPSGFNAENLFAAHYASDTATRPDRYYRTTDNGNGTVTFSSKDFSPYEFVKGEAFASVTYHYADGTMSNENYDQADIGVTLLPVDETVAEYQTWNGWSIVDENSEAPENSV